MPAESRRAAQQRADQIRAFRAELSALGQEGANPLAADQQAAIAVHHDHVLARLARKFDIDRSVASGQLSRGLRLASFFGAATLVAAITSFISRYWGGLGLPAQVTLLTMFPLVSLAAVQVAAERERTRYVAALFALVALGTAWVAIVLTADLLDLPFSALLLWPGTFFGLAVALSYGFRLVLALALGSLAVAVASVFFVAGGVPWPTLVERLEPLTGAGFLLVTMAPRLGPAGEGVEETTRITGLAIALGGLLALATAHGTSLLAFDPSTTLLVYQALMLIVSLAVLSQRLRAGDRAGTMVATVALALFLFIRYLDWFWSRVPAWAFFLILAVLAFASIAWLRRLRGQVAP